MFKSRVTWNASVLPIFNQAFYKLFLLTPQADSHILGGYLIPSLTFFTLRVLEIDRRPESSLLKLSCCLQAKRCSAERLGAALFLPL